MVELEIWKDILNYEGHYRVSNLGRIKSLNRFVKGKSNSVRELKEKILTPTLNTKGYLHLKISKHGVYKSKTVHKLVAETFLNHTSNGMKSVINHMDLNKLNNKADNLEITTNRENSNKKHLKSISDYVGVSWHKQNKNWYSRIQINGKTKFLGSFDCEIEASNAYQKALSELKMN